MANDGKPVARLGEPVRGSRSGQPIMVLFDLLSRRWAMGILWNLAEGPRTFRDLQDALRLGLAQRSQHPPQGIAR
jgi:DNA-binding HxlR family transcriptional regulator